MKIALDSQHTHTYIYANLYTVYILVRMFQGHKSEEYEVVFI